MGRAVDRDYMMNIVSVIGSISSLMGLQNISCSWLMGARQSSCNDLSRFATKPSCTMSLLPEKHTSAQYVIIYP